MGKQTRRLVTTVIAAVLLVTVGILAGFALVGNSVMSALPVVGRLFTVEPPVTTTGPVTVGAIRDLNELATVEREDYVLITRESGGTELGRIFTGEAVSLIAVGEVRAGVNLAELGEDDVQVDEEAGIVSINLPEPEILGVSLDEDQTLIYDRDYSLLNPGRGDDDLGEEARDAAIDRIEQAALDEGLLEMANENAETSLSTFILALGYDEVNFE